MMKNNSSILRLSFLVVIWFSFFLSINLNPLEFFEFNIINKLRLLGPTLFMIILILTKYNNKKILKIFNIYKLPFMLIFILYFIFCVISPENSKYNLFWPFYMFLSFFFISSFADDTDLTVLFYITFFFILILFLIFISFGIYEMIEETNPHFYAIGIKGNAEGQITNTPRSSGLARMSLLIYTFILIFCFSKKKGNWYLLFSISIFGFFVLIFQSRTMSFIFFFMILFHMVFNFKDFFFNKKIFIFALIIPILSVWAYQIEMKHLQKGGKGSSLTYILKDTLIRDQISEKKNVYSDKKYKYKINRFSSGRFENWQIANEIMRENYFKGFGAQSDRIFINQSIHNSLIYSLLSGGIISFLALMVIYLLTLILLIKLYFFKKEDELKTEEKIAIAVIIILNLRSILETSIAIYSIDYLVYIICYLYLFSNNNFFKKK